MASLLSSLFRGIAGTQLWPVMAMTGKTFPLHNFLLAATFISKQNLGNSL